MIATAAAHAASTKWTKICQKGRTKMKQLLSLMAIAGVLTFFIIRDRRQEDEIIYLEDMMDE